MARTVLMSAKEKSLTNQRQPARRSTMKVLFATSEFADFAKAGGLGDVSAGLPRALKLRGVDVRVLMPAYPEVLAKASDITIVAHLPGLRRDRSLLHR